MTATTRQTLKVGDRVVSAAGMRGIVTRLLGNKYSAGGAYFVRVTWASGATSRVAESRLTKEAE